MATARKKPPLLKVGTSPKKSSAAQTPRLGLPIPAPGRPPSNIGKYLLKPTAEMDTGFEVINSDPDVLTRVHKQYLKAGQLPPALQPKYIRKPEVMDKQRGLNISKGWRKPRSQQG